MKRKSTFRVCKYSSDCFRCPKKDCLIDNPSCINILPGDIIDVTAKHKDDPVKDWYNHGKINSIKIEKEVYKD